MRIYPPPPGCSKNGGWATVSRERWNGTESKRGLYFTFLRFLSPSSSFLSLSLSIFHPLIHSLSRFYTSIVPYSSVIPLPHIVPYVYSYILVRTYPSSLIPTHSLSLSHSGEKYILHLSSSLKFSFACIYIRLFAIPPIFSPSLVPSKHRFPGTRGLLRMLLLVRRNTNSGSQIYRFLIS